MCIHFRIHKVDNVVAQERDLQWNFFWVKIYFFWMLSGRELSSSIFTGDDLSKNIRYYWEIIGRTLVRYFRLSRYFRTISFRKSWLSRLLLTRVVLKTCFCLTYNLSGVVSTDGKCVIDLNLLLMTGEVSMVWEKRFLVLWRLLLSPYILPNSDILAG